MSNASEVMERLLQGEQVEWRPLGEVAEFSKGRGLPKRLILDDGEYPCIHYGELFTTYAEEITEVISRTNQKPEDSIVSRANDVLMPTSDVTPTGLATASCIQKDNVILGGDILIIRCPKDQVDGRYLSYFLNSKKNLILRIVKGTTVFHLYAKDLAKLQAPIPPLHVQEKIVSILDTFTELTKELTKEQQARQIQYEYYRDKLLTFEDGEVEWKTLDECFEIIAGGDVPREALSETYAEEFPVPVLSNGIEENSIYGWTNRARITEPSLTISARGTIGWTSIRYKPFFPIVRLLVLTPKREQKLSLRYAYYYMKAIENSYKLPSSGIPQLTRPMIRGIKIPIPPLHVQQEIVDKLDRFNALANSITEGLPREIKLRQQQYEYYRDLLLDFPNAA